MRITHDDLQRALLRVLGESLRVSGSHGWLEILLPEDPTQSSWSRGELLWVTAQLGAWDDAGDIISIKEQDVSVAPHGADPDRLEAMLTAWAGLLPRILAQGELVEVRLMPSDLFCPGVLSLKRPRTPETFAAALAVPSRLGRYL